MLSDSSCILRSGCGTSVHIVTTLPKGAFQIVALCAVGTTRL